MVAAAILPGVPVTDEQAVVDPTRARSRDLVCKPRHGARDRVFTVRKDLESHVEGAIRPRPEAIDIEGEVRDLARFSTVQRQSPDLAGAGAGRQKVE